MKTVLFFQYPWRLWRERLAGMYRYARTAGWHVCVAEYGRNFKSVSGALRFYSPAGARMMYEVAVSIPRLVDADMSWETR